MTHDRILAAAAALFAEHGYRRTSMQEIATRVGITKAALYYHFQAKDDLLRQLTLPLLNELERVLREAERADTPEAVRWRAIEGYVDVHLKHRDTLLMLVRDMTLLAETAVADRFRAAIALTNTLVSGPGADLEQRVRASQVVAGLADPVVIFRDAPPRILKPLILAGAQTLLGADGAASPRRQAGPRARGRPQALTADDHDRIRHMYGSGRFRIDEIADQLHVSRATVYRSLKK